MRLVADASALVAELLRARGRALLTHPEIDWLATEQVASEVHHEIVRRAAALMRRHGRSPDEGGALARRALDLFSNAVAIVPEPTYAPAAELARRRLVDEQDCSSVALAMVVGTGIWTDDRDFCGIGLPTWQTRVLLAEFGLTG
jgi:predicted nucleic acid-binding protein